MNAAQQQSPAAAIPGWAWGVFAAVILPLLVFEIWSATTQHQLSHLYRAGLLTHLKDLHYGLAAVLTFAALKIALQDWFEIPPVVSILVVVGLIGGAVWASLRARRPDQARG